MDKIISVLLGKNNFSITFKEKKYTSLEIISIALSISKEILSLSNGKDYLYFFCPKNNLEAFVYYCVNSLMNGTAIITSLDNLNNFISLVPRDKDVFFILPNKALRPERAGKYLYTDIYNCSYKLSDVNSLNIDNNTQARFIFSTSGTTGKPKLIRYVENNLLANAKEVSSYLELTSHSKSLCIFPIQYMYGLSTTLCSLWSDSELHYLSSRYDPNVISNYTISNNIDVLPILGDWILDLKKYFVKQKYSVKHLLNASDRLLENQAINALTFCNILWNNFGQTESGPRIFYNKIISKNDIFNTSRDGVVAPGFVMNPFIYTKLKDSYSGKIGDIGELVYSTPYGMEGYLDSDMQLIDKNRWQDSGDLFEINEAGCHFWIKRIKEDLKVNGKFFPSQLIYNEFVNKVGKIRCVFSKSLEGKIGLFIDSSLTPKENINLETIRIIIRKYWSNSHVDIFIKEKLKETASGKLKLLQY